MQVRQPRLSRFVEYGGCSSSTATATLGVPVGIEFLGRPWSEEPLIEIGYGYEQAAKHRRTPPTTPPIEASAS
jgi:amidase